MGNNTYTQQQMSFSKNCLFDAALKLLQTKEEEEITISELTKEAGVSRSTFYRYYHSVKDVIRDFLESHPLGFPSTMVYEDHSDAERVDIYYDYIVENATLFRLIAKPEYQQYFLNVLDRTFHGPFRSIIREMGYESDYEVSALIGIIFKVTVDWVNDGMPGPLEEIKKEATQIITRFYKNRPGTA